MKYKKDIVITIIVTTLILILRKINVFQIENNLGKPISLLIMIILCSFFTIFIQRKIDDNYNKGEESYSNIDLIKYIFAILILILHFRPFLHSQNQLDLAFNNIVTRICVPFFFLVTGYFVAKKERNNADYIKSYIKKIIPLYLIWSAIYIPIIIATVIEYWPAINQYLININISIPVLILLFILLLPLIIIVALLYTGVYYHLWYFPAVIFPLIVLSKWKKKFDIKYLLVTSFILLLFGATETYYGALPFNIKQLTSYYYNIFFTTRNFLFFGLFYVVLGYIMGTKEKVYSSYCFVNFIISCFLLTFEGIILHSIERLNSNILLFCVPLVYYLFISILYLNDILKAKNLMFRSLSKYYYLVHPAVLFFFIPLLEEKGGDVMGSFFLLFVVLFITHIVSLIILKLKEKYPRLII